MRWGNYGINTHLKQSPFFLEQVTGNDEQRRDNSRRSVSHQLKVPSDECQRLSTSVPADRCFIRPNCLLPMQP